MAIVYFDASALVKLIVQEEGTDLAVELWDGCDAAVSSRLSHPEVRSAVARAARDGRLHEQDRAFAEEEWEGYWSEVRQIEFTESVSRHAGELAGSHFLRGADAVHLASALAIPTPGLVMAVWDGRLQAGAADVDLLVAPHP